MVVTYVKKGGKDHIGGNTYPVELVVELIVDGSDPNDDTWG